MGDGDPSGVGAGDSEGISDGPGDSDASEGGGETGGSVSTAGLSEGARVETGGTVVPADAPGALADGPVVAGGGVTAADPQPATTASVMTASVARRSQKRFTGTSSSPTTGLRA